MNRRQHSRVGILSLLLAITVFGCGTFADPLIQSKVRPADGLNIYYWSTPEYIVQAGALSISPSQALKLAQQAGGAMYSQHHFIVDDCYVFSFLDKQLGNPLVGYYVHGVTGEVTRRDDVPEFTMADFHRRWPDEEFQACDLSRGMPVSDKMLLEVVSDDVECVPL